MILAPSWADVVTSFGTIVAAAAVPWGVYVYRADLRRRRQEREDDLSRQARLASISIEPVYALGTKISPRILGGLDTIKFAVANGSNGPIRHVTVELGLPWAPRYKTRETFDLILANSERKGNWYLGGDVLPLPKGQNELGRDDVRAVATLMDAHGVWWQIERGNPHPVRLLSPIPGVAPAYTPVRVRVAAVLQRILNAKPSTPPSNWATADHVDSGRGGDYPTTTAPTEAPTKLAGPHSYPERG